MGWRNAGFGLGGKDGFGVGKAGFGMGGKKVGFGMGKSWIWDGTGRDLIQSTPRSWGCLEFFGIQFGAPAARPGYSRRDPGVQLLWSVGIGNVSSLDLLLTFPWQPRPRRISSGGNKRLEAGKDIPGVLLTGRNSGMEPLNGGSRWIWQEHNS